mmetsp:Transcript_79727/g.247382  ORF Transcript_79727/g.247382 Transcript_79727/m.247382 type:complete len:243 (+) Transcript_79727:425-1153(+)
MAKCNGLTPDSECLSGSTPCRSSARMAGRFGGCWSMASHSGSTPATHADLLGSPSPHLRAASSRSRSRACRAINTAWEQLLAPMAKLPCLSRGSSRAASAARRWPSCSHSCTRHSLPSGSLTPASGVVVASKYSAFQSYQCQSAPGPPSGASASRAGATSMRGHRSSQHPILATEDGRDRPSPVSGCVSWKCWQLRSRVQRSRAPHHRRSETCTCIGNRHKWLFGCIAPLPPPMRTPGCCET